MDIRSTNDFISIYKNLINMIAFKVDDLIDNNFILSFLYFLIDYIIYNKIERSNISYR